MVSGTFAPDLRSSSEWGHLGADLQGLPLLLDTVLKVKRFFRGLKFSVISEINKNKFLLVIKNKTHTHTRDTDYTGEQAKAYIYSGFKILTSNLGR